ncbi:DUF6300 family protein [Streptomyces sp. NPDC004647]|uniref:DUF6300 family protein n=1 Tax=Streptomyces sp. NPDC004647 TaxID=3154671 RepID=UPI0033AE9E29
MSGRVDGIVLRITDPPNCARCEGPGLLLARFPDSWKNARSEDVRGLREAALCPACDRGGAAADELLALFAVDDQVGLSNAELLGELVAEWVEYLRHRKVDAALLDEEHGRWERGNL